MLQPLTYVFFALFVAVTIVQLVAAFLEKEMLRKITKPFCVFFLALAVVVTLPTHPHIYIGAF